jgi:cytochrome P450
MNGTREIVVDGLDRIDHVVGLLPRLNRPTAAALLGVALHQLVFRKGEWHLQAPALFTLWLSSHAILFLAESILSSGRDWKQSVKQTLLITGCFTAAIFSSIVVGRLFRLRDFPGPRLAGASKLWHSLQCLDGKNYRVLHKLHQQYGDFVRTGPNEITVFDPEVLVRLDGPGNRTQKSAWYDFLMPDVGVTTIRHKPFHDQRRRIWTRAISSKVMPFYEEQMVEHAQQLEEIIRQSSDQGESVDFSSLAYWFSFDIMGVFALAKSFNMLHDKKWHYAVTNLRRAMSLLGPLSSVPWLGQIGFKFLKGYWVIKDWHSMTGWCRDRIQEKVHSDDENMSIASYLINDARAKNTVEEDHHLLAGESIVAIVAGSDTVAPTMVFMFYELAQNPAQAEKLYEELQGVNIRDCQALEKLPHLNAVIDETMRLHPAVPTGGYRDTPPEGMTINNRYIPGNVTIVAPRFSIFRSEKCYVEPEKFIPERWYSRPELVKDARSFLPFAQGKLLFTKDRRRVPPPANYGTYREVYMLGQGLGTLRVENRHCSPHFQVPHWLRARRRRCSSAGGFEGQFYGVSGEPSPELCTAEVKGCVTTYKIAD